MPLASQPLSQSVLALHCSSNESWHRVTLQTGGHAVTGLRDTRTSSGLVYSSMCTIILLCFAPPIPHIQESSRSIWRWFKNLSWWTCVLFFSNSWRTGDAVITCFICAWCFLPVAGKCSCRQNGAEKKCCFDLEGCLVLPLTFWCCNETICQMCVSLYRKRLIINNADNWLATYSATFSKIVWALWWTKQGFEGWLDGQ